MIVCSCTGVTDHDIRHAVAWMRASDPLTLITPGKIYRSLGKAPQCGSCIRLFVDEMRRHGETEVPARLRGLRRQPQARAAAAG